MPFEVYIILPYLQQSIFFGLGYTAPKVQGWREGVVGIFGETPGMIPSLCELLAVSVAVAVVAAVSVVVAAGVVLVVVVAVVVVVVVVVSLCWLHV